MAKRKKVFISFQYQDKGLKNALVGEVKNQKIPVSFVDRSLREAHPNDEWVPEAEAKIAECDVFVTIQGMNTLEASGVLKEISVAKRLGKPRFQLKHKTNYGPEIPDAGPSVDWKWDLLIPWFTVDEGRKGKR